MAFKFGTFITAARAVVFAVSPLLERHLTWNSEFFIRAVETRTAISTIEPPLLVFFFPSLPTLQLLASRDMQKVFKWESKAATVGDSQAGIEGAPTIHPTICLASSPPRECACCWRRMESLSDCLFNLKCLWNGRRRRSRGTCGTTRDEVDGDDDDGP